MLRIYTLLLFLFTAIHFSGQNENDLSLEKDSLLKVIPTLDGEKKLFALRNLSKLHAYAPLDTALAYNALSLLEARKQKNTLFEGGLLLDKLLIYFNNAKYDLFSENVNSALDFFRKNEQWTFYYTIYRIRIVTCYKEQKYETAIRYAQKMYEEAKASENIFGQGSAASIMGTIYEEMKQYPKAIWFLKETISIFSEHQKKDITYRLDDAYFRLVPILCSEKQFDEALNMLEKYRKHVRENYESVDVYLTDRLVFFGGYYQTAAHVYAELKDFDKVEQCLDSVKIIDLKANSNISFFNYAYYHALISESKGEYEKALDESIEAYEFYLAKENEYHYAYTINALKLRTRLLCQMERSKEAYPLFEEITAKSDSLRNLEFNAQLDDFRTIYEVDKIETEKKSLRNYLLFALGGCFLLIILLGIWLYYSRLIMNKNRAMVKTIHELQEEQIRRTDEIFRKTSFEPIEDANDKLHPKTRKDELCVAIRDLIFKEKIYLDPELTRDSLINRLGINKLLFTEAFVLCFGTVSFTEHINSLRLKDAITLLEQTDLPMETISERAGFGTVRTFQRQFKTKYDMPPYDYRKLVAT